MRYKEFKEFERTINKIKQLIKEGQIKSAVESPACTPYPKGVWTNSKRNNE